MAFWLRSRDLGLGSEESWLRSRDFDACSVRSWLRSRAFRLRYSQRDRHSGRVGFVRALLRLVYELATAILAGLASFAHVLSGTTIMPIRQVALFARPRCSLAGSWLRLIGFSKPFAPASAGRSARDGPWMLYCPRGFLRTSRRQCTNTHIHTSIYYAICAVWQCTQVSSLGRWIPSPGHPEHDRPHHSAIQLPKNMVLGLDAAGRQLIRPFFLE
jgi:hypothetical protein